MVNHLVNYLRCHQCHRKSNTHAKLVWLARLRLNYHHMRKWEWLSNCQMLVSLYLKSPQRHQACQANSTEIRDHSQLLIQCSSVVKNLKRPSSKPFHQGIQLLLVEPNKCKTLRYRWRVVVKISIAKGEVQACEGRKNQSPLFLVDLNPHLLVAEVVVSAWLIQMSIKKRSFLRTSTV